MRRNTGIYYLTMNRREMEDDAGFPGRGAAVYRGTHLDGCRCRIWLWLVSYEAQAQGYFPPGR